MPDKRIALIKRRVKQEGIEVSPYPCRGDATGTKRLKTAQSVINREVMPLGLWLPRASTLIFCAFI
jgi:hypothetical protein